MPCAAEVEVEEPGEVYAYPHDHGGDLLGPQVDQVPHFQHYARSSQRLTYALRLRLRVRRTAAAAPDTFKVSASDMALGQGRYADLDDEDHLQTLRHQPDLPLRKACKGRVAHLHWVARATVLTIATAVTML